MGVGKGYIFLTTNSTMSSLAFITILVAILLSSIKHPGITLLRLLPIITVFFLLIELLFKPRNWCKKNPLPPGPKPWPIIGSLPEMFRNKPAFRWILGTMKELNTDIACFRLGNVHVIPVNCPHLGQEFLKKQDELFASRPITMASEYLSRGFLTTAVTPYGDQWKKMRVVCSQVINPKTFQWLRHKRVEEADNLVRFVYNQCKSAFNDATTGSIINVRVVAQQYCGNVIRKLMFSQRYFGEGSEDGGPGVEEEEYIDAFFTVLLHLFAFCASDYIPCLRPLDLDGHEKVVKEAMAIINKHHDPMIDRRIQERRGANNYKKVPEDLLDILISLKDKDGNPMLSAEEIKAQTAELVIATVDNPSNAVEWALAEMINQPHILNKAMEEIDEVVGRERLVQESDFSQLNYVKACAREAFRLHPVAPFNVPHVSQADTTVSGYFIPKGSHVLLSRYGLGRNPKVWDEPLKFKPERHLEGGLAKVELVEPQLRFISFSTGRRGCLGSGLGSAMTVMLLARVLQGFSWSTPPGVARIDLSESGTDLFLAKPLHSYAKLRLPMHFYPI